MEFLNDLLLKTYAPLSMEAWMTFITVLVIYFAMEYKTKSGDENFSLGFWIKDNVINLVISFGFFVWYNLSAEVIKSSSLIFIATSANLLIDWIMTLKSKYKK